jgi:hypothetical protein
LEWDNLKKMKYRRLISLSFLLICTLSLLAKVRVLSVCVGSYPKESGWSNLSSINDNYSILDTYPEAVSLLDAEATYEAITSELGKLCKIVNIGDTIIVHFSGHGQQILTLTSGTEADLVDEAIVPYNALKHKNSSYSGEKHLTDDLFGSYISKIRKKVNKSGLVIAVIDACHSNSMDKDTDNSEDIYRGTDEIFGAESLSPDSIVAIRDRYFTNDNTPVISSENMATAIFIGACGTHQRNYEIKIDGVGHGSLSYYFCQTVKEKGIADINVFLSSLYSSMTEDATMRFHGQRPNIRTSFGWKAPELPRYIPTPTAPLVVEESSAWRLWFFISIGLILLFISVVVWKKKK